MTQGFQCPICGFGLWHPIGALKVSHLGLYDDARFPGRCILSLNDHAEHWEELDPSLLHDFVDDSRTAISAIRGATGAQRVNLAVLGNTDPHIHFHLIPRSPSTEPNPMKSPWSDPRKQEQLPPGTVSELISLIADFL
jgi:diadenosine tetraphosphate (Ap4A) HIT family hydrolase